MKQVKACSLSDLGIMHKVLKTDAAAGELITILCLRVRKLLECPLDFLEGTAHLTFLLPTNLILDLYYDGLNLVRPLLRVNLILIEDGSFCSEAATAANSLNYPLQATFSDINQKKY